MARKRKSDDQGISLDSLMDALTNVVAVLILVLILVQADVTQKVQKFLDDLPPASPEEIAQSKQRIEDLKLKLQIAEARLREEPPTAEVIAEEKRRIELLEESMEESKELLADLEKLKELEKKIRAERNQENRKTVAIQEEIAKLEALLDDTPVVDPNQPTVVSIPNSRPIPDDAKVYHAIAWKDRIHIIDPHTPLELFNREFERHKKDWLLQRVRKKGAADLYIYDRSKIAKHFKDFDWKNSRGQDVSLLMPETSTRVYIVIKPDIADGGTPLEELGEPGNAFAKAAILLRQDFDSVLMFLVSNDSFNTYLKARELIDRANIAAGWQMTWKNHVRTLVPDILIKRAADPKPRPDKPKPPGPPPLKPKLD